MNIGELDASLRAMPRIAAGQAADLSTYAAASMPEDLSPGVRHGRRCCGSATSPALASFAHRRAAE
jgi:hypothetical protein